MNRFLLKPLCCLAALLAFAPAAFAQPSAPLPTITLDEFLNTTDISAAHISPDGSAAVIATDAPDWKAGTYRHTLSLWTPGNGLRPLTQAGTDEDPQWSPDGQWIAFLSDRALLGEPATDDSSSKDSDDATRVWLIPVSGGEAQPLFREKLDVHSFAWSPDGKSIYFATQQPLTHDQEETKKDEWRDVIRWREQERGDLLLALPVAPSLARTAAIALPHDPSNSSKAEDSDQVLPAGVTQLAQISQSITEISPSPDGKSVAYLTDAVSRRFEAPSQTEIYAVPSTGGPVRQLTHNQAIESDVQWSPDAQWLYFVIRSAGGSVDHTYQDIAGRVFRLNPAAPDPADKSLQRLGADFTGGFESLTVAGNGAVYALGLKGTEQQIYSLSGPTATRLPGLPGSYAGVSATHSGNAVLVRFSSINHPAQVYLASDAAHLDQAVPLTALNPIFAQRAQPEWGRYTWKAPDGVTVEGVLIFPPGKLNAKHLRMLTLIHGGPADADGNRFGADWYDWATLAASNGWLVFRPNYRGSAGYGDQFMLQYSPHLVSKPGLDILAGVDALVGDGLADPDKLTIGGYSYGGYMTNWLITQTTRFKAAVTGAGAVEHAANWGNDDMNADDAWVLGGHPWQQPAMYQSEAALFFMDKVKTPTHLVQGGADVRVSYLEGVTMERALQNLGIPHSFLVFPGEGHSLAHNPWHGYIKLREELAWLAKYCPQ
jgi:dipeptidyl aminopeptidase/acylaminoacyl peptidase